MTKQLQNKLKAYSALTAAAALMGTSAKADVIYTSVNYTGGPNETYNIDIDNNGVSDFSISQAGFTSSYGIGCVPIGGRVNINALNGEFLAAAMGGGNYFNLNSSQMVSASASFGFYGSVYGSLGGYYFSCVPSYYGSWANNFGSMPGSANGTKMIGVRFDQNGSTHYGWMRISIDVWAGQFTVVDMAYECVNDEGILTGATSGGFVDATAPVADVASLSDVTSCGPINSLGDLTIPTATDASCVGQVSATTTASFPITSSTTITWKYDDGLGNTSTQNQNIIIDAGAPVADAGTLSDINSCDPIASVGDLTAPTATDDLDGTVTGTTSASFPITASTTITWTYEDACGNTSTQDQNINVTTVNSGVTVTSTMLSSDETDGSATYQWIDCDNGNAAITDETNKDYTPIANGNYAVQVTLNGCTVTSSCVTFTGTVGVTNVETIKNNMYPNPASDEITIELAELGANTTMTVVDVTGKVVKELKVTDNKTVINLTDFSSGIYLVKISSEKGNNTVKFVKK